MNKISLQAKKAFFKKIRLMNYQASMRLEGINLIGSGSSSKPFHGLTREEVLEKYRPVK